MPNLFSQLLCRRPAPVPAPGPKTFVLNIAALGPLPAVINPTESPGHIVVRVKGEIHRSEPATYMVAPGSRRWWHRRRADFVWKLLPVARVIWVNAESVDDIKVEFTGALARVATPQVLITELPR